jgi:S-DNA-T family DNA segregation ATPase FtsK/SpoIIIE
MLRRLPGDEVRGLVSTTPDTAVVFRPAVVQTPAIITIVVILGRFIAGLLRTVIVHPVAVLVVIVPAVVWYSCGWQAAVVAVTVPGSLLLAWAVSGRGSFCRWVGWPLLAFWRRIGVYRRHWQPVMIVSGLGRHLQGRDYLPRLLRVACDGRADRVTVKMLAGQSAEDWTKRIDHLAHGFGATSCSVSIARAGRLVLTFPRRDLLAVPLPAVPLPDVRLLRAIADRQRWRATMQQLQARADGQPQQDLSATDVGRAA